MCWSVTASIGMVGLGTIATTIAISRGEPKAIWLTLGYFTIMEALQTAGYRVVNECGTTANQSITWLSYLHIAFQPFFINAFAMQLVPEQIRINLQRWVYMACAVSSVTMIAQLIPIDWAGSCLPGTPLCGDKLCLMSGQWHIAWHIPYNGLLVPIEDFIGLHAGFPTYMLTVFAMPIIYGAWKFVAMHAVVGPIAAHMLTDNPNEMPAIWCLFSIGILLIALSPVIRQRFETTNWYAWPKAGDHKA